MIPKLTEDAVSRLPLESGRAELLEEIMSTTATERRTAEPTELPGRRRGWLAPLAVAATVAAVASTSLWWGGGDEHAGGQVGSSASPATVSESSERLLLDAPGWRLDSPGSDGDVFRNGKASLEVTRYPGDSYADYVVDREHIYDPPAPGAPIEVLGRSAQMWAYSADDHAAIREVVDGQWMEFRGQGMDEAAYLEVLGRLELVSLKEFEAAMPARFVSESESQEAIDTMLGGIEAAIGPARSAFPMGHAPTLQSDEEDPYQLGAYVAGQVTCAWIDQYVEARAAGDEAAASDAAAVLATSRQWPVLQAMDSEGDYSEVVWDYADKVLAGQVPESYAGGLGCS